MLRIYPKTRIVEVTRRPPQRLHPLLSKPINRVRQLLPKTPQPDPQRMWLLLRRGRVTPFARRKDMHFTAEPLFTGPPETEPSYLLGEDDSTTYITIKSSDFTVIYQNLHTKASWRRQGVSRAMLLRLQDHLHNEGDPSIQGCFTHPGWGTAKHMQKNHGWGIIGSPPTTPHDPDSHT